jgi:hypothetical protein
MSKSRLHRYLALHLLRDWLGMATTDALLQETPHVNELLLALERITRKQFSKGRESDVAGVLSHLLCYELDKDQLRLTDKARKFIADSQQQQTEKSFVDRQLEKFTQM